MPYGRRFLNRSCERTIRGAAASTVQVKYGGCGVRRETCNSAPNSASPRLRVEGNISLIDGLRSARLGITAHTLKECATFPVTPAKRAYPTEPVHEPESTHEFF